MSWNPSRSRGLMFEKYSAKSDLYRSEYSDLIESGKHLKFEHINRLSLCLYLYWLNENKAYCTLTGRAFNKNKPHYSLEGCASLPLILPMLKRNLNLIYKPMREMLSVSE